MTTDTVQLDPPGHSKLTAWEKEPTILDLKKDLEAVRQTQQTQVSKINRWNDLTHVRGSAKPAKIKGRSSVQPKMIRRQNEWRYSALSEPFLKDDKVFQVTPSTHEDTTAARQAATLLNWQFRTKLNRVNFVDHYVRSTVDEGTCIVRVGWHRVTTMITEMVPQWEHYPVESEEQIQALQQAMELKQADPRGYDEQVDPALKAAIDYYEESQEATVAVQVGEQAVQVEKIIENRPTCEVKNPANIYIDPTCLGDLDKALFVIESFETNKAALQKEGKYKNLDRVEWSANAPMNDGTHDTSTPTSFQFADEARKKVVAYEYWGLYDIHGDGVLVPIVATWVGNTLIRLEENPYPDQKVPYVLVTYNPVKRELYGEPDAEMLEDNQAVVGAITRGMIDVLGRSANGQQGFAKGMLDAMNRRKFDNGQDYEFNPQSNPQHSLIEHKYPELPQSAFMMLNLQNNDAEALTGVKSFAGGMSGDQFGDVAAGIRGVLDAASKREMGILRRLASGVAQVGTKISAMNVVFLSEKEIVRVTNEEFVEVNREDLAGNYDTIVDITTAEIEDAKAKDLAFMLQTMGNNLDISITLMILAEIARLKQMPELAKRIESFKPQKSPAEEEAEKLTLEKLRLEVEELKSKVELNRASARAKSSEADMKDLDYVEQETGTKHARDLQNTREQSRGNANLKIVDALTKPKKEGEKSPDIEAAIGYSALTDRTDQDFRSSPIDLDFAA